MPSRSLRRSLDGVVFFAALPRVAPWAIICRPYRARKIRAQNLSPLQGEEDTRLKSVRPYRAKKIRAQYLSPLQSEEDTRPISVASTGRGSHFYILDPLPEANRNDVCFVFFVCFVVTSLLAGIRLCSNPAQKKKSRGMPGFSVLFDRQPINDRHGDDFRFALPKTRMSTIHCHCRDRV